MQLKKRTQQMTRNALLARSQKRQDEQRKKEPKLKKVARAILAIHDEPASEPTPGLREANPKA